MEIQENIFRVYLMMIYMEIVLFYKVTLRFQASEDSVGRALVLRPEPELIPGSHKVSGKN